MKYVVTGATGHLGGFILGFLKKAGAEKDTIALVRSADKGKALEAEGFETRVGDYTDPESLVKAFSGADRLFFVSSGLGGSMPRVQQHENVIKAAKKAGIQFIAYTSLVKTDQSASFLAGDHLATEKYIQASGIEYTILRNNWYLENEMSVLQLAKATGEFVYSAGDGKVGWALRREYAEAGANVLLGKFPKTGILEMSGPRVTYQALAEALGKVLPNQFQVKGVSDDDYKIFLEGQKVPAEGVAAAIMIQQEIRSGVLDIDHSDFAAVLGREPLPLADAVKEVLA